MVTLAKHMWACAQCRGALSCILKALGCHVDQRADDIVFFDDCRSFSHVPGLHKRSRSDRDYRRALLDQVIKRRKGSQRAPFVGADGYARGTEFKWCVQELAALQRCTYRLWEEYPGVVVVKSDAARLGMPAKDFVHYVCHLPAAGHVAVALPPTVSCHMK